MNNNLPIYPITEANIKQFKCNEKVVFAEPYKNAPNFYLNNGFICGKANCKPCKKPFNYPKNCKCFPPEQENPNFSCGCKDKPQKNECGGSLPNFSNLFQLLGIKNLGNFSSLLGGKTDLSGILGGLSSENIGSLLNILTQNGGGIGNLLGLFKPKSPNQINTSPKSSDICIKDFERVE